MVSKINNISLNTDILQNIEQSRLDASKEVEYHKQKLLEQYFTPLDIVKYMASLFTHINDVKILDAGAGVGNLGTVVAIKFLEEKSLNVNLTLVEWDKNLLDFLKNNLSSIKNEFLNFQYKIRSDNFYRFAAEKINKGVKYNRIILNPPYSKTSNSSETELELLKQLNIKTPNSYTNFIEICINLLSDEGELVAIVPRSFCNGTRFTKFRNNLIENVRIEFIHLFESRKKVFKEYGVLQEIIIIKLTKKYIKYIDICISDEMVNNKIEKFPYDKIIFHNDPYKFIHIPDKATDEETINKIYKLPSSLKELGLSVSTGKVVEYRDPDLIKDNKNNPTAALVIYQNYLEDNIINFNKPLNKPLFLNFYEKSKHKVIPAGEYILIKRISYKESKKRLSTVILSKEDFKNEYMTVENHLNYIHDNGKGIGLFLAIGLNAFLNTKTLDSYIRRFSGHTQINASDILSLPMPALKTLVDIGENIYNNNIAESEIEELIFKG